MRAMRAEAFGGYQDLKLVDIARPGASEGRLLVRMTAAGVTPLEHTILSGHFPLSTAPLERKPSGVNRRGFPDAGEI